MSGINNPGVTSFNTRAGAVTLSKSDVDGAFAGGAAWLAQANTFIVSPQTIVPDDDAHKGLIVKAHSPTQSVNLLETQTSTGSPLTSVDKAGNLLSSKHAGFGANAVIDPSTGTIQGPIVLYAAETFTDPTVNYYGLVSYTIVDPVSSQQTGHGSVTGLFSLMEITGSQDTGYSQAAIYQIDNLNSGHSAGLNPFYAEIVNEGGGTVDLARPIQVYIENDAGSTITQSQGIYIYRPSNDGTWVDHAAIYIEDQSGIGSNSSYSIQLAGSGSKVLFEGNLEVGSFKMATGAGAGKVLTSDSSGNGTWGSAGGTGTVTTVSVVTANGLAGTVANATTTPAITLTTSITGVLLGNGTAISASNVTNDVQTKAAIVPNTAPSAGQVLIGNAGGTAYAPQSIASPFALSATGGLTIAADVPFATHKATGVGDPTSAQDAATKNYVDAAIQGITSKHVARVATTTTLATYTYLSGVITFSSTGTNTIDGQVLALNDYVLVKNETSTLKPNNGLYKVTIAGAIGIAGVWTRSVDMDAGTEFPGATVFTEQGSTNAGASWICTNSTPPTVGSTDITFVQFGAGTTYSADETTLHLSGTQFSIISTYTGQSSIVTVGTLTGGATSTGFTISLGMSTVTGQLTVPNGGTGLATLTAYAPLFGGTTSTGVVQSGTVGTAGQVLTSNGAGALPTFQVVSSMVKSVNQSAHGLSVGNAIRLSGASTYTKAQADSAANAEVVGLVTVVTDANNFIYALPGSYVTGLSSLTANTGYWLDQTTAGALTATPPTTAGQVSKALLWADTTTSGIFLNYPGIILGSTTNHGVIVGTGTGTTSTAAGAAGTVLTGNGSSADPTFQYPAVDNGICQGRVTATSGLPVTTADVTGATSIYWTPTKGNRVALWDGSKWVLDVLTEVTVALGTIINAQAYDVFGYDSSGTPAAEILEWQNATITCTSATPAVVTWTAHGLVTGNSITFTNSGGALPSGISANTQYFVTVVDANTFKLSTTAINVGAGTFVNTTNTGTGTHTGHSPTNRQTAVTLQDGVLCKSGDKTRRYLGTFLTTATTTTEDSAAKRFVWNYYNRVCRTMINVTETSDSWGYSTGSYRQSNANVANQLAYVCGIAEEPVEAYAYAICNSANAGILVVGIGVDSTTANSALTHGDNNNAAIGNNVFSHSATYRGIPGIGYHYLPWLENSSCASTTWYGDAGNSVLYQAGINGSGFA